MAGTLVAFDIMAFGTSGACSGGDDGLPVFEPLNSDRDPLERRPKNDFAFSIGMTDLSISRKTWILCFEASGGQEGDVCPGPNSDTNRYKKRNSDTSRAKSKGCFVWIAQCVDWLLRTVGEWVIPRRQCGAARAQPKHVQ